MQSKTLFRTFGVASAALVLGAGLAGVQPSPEGAGPPLTPCVLAAQANPGANVVGGGGVEDDDRVRNCEVPV